jgi:hypothetical protein
VRYCVQIGGILTPYHENTFYLPSLDQPGDLVPTCIAWNIRDILASSSLSAVAAAGGMPSSLSSIPLSVMPRVMHGGSFIQLTGARAHEWLYIGGFPSASYRQVTTVMNYNMLTDRWSHDSTVTTTGSGVTFAITTPSIIISAVAAAAVVASTAGEKKTPTDNKEASSPPPSSPPMVYAFGGLVNARGDMMNYTCEVYNTMTRAWSQLTSSLHIPRSAAAAIWIPLWHAFIICGGYSGHEAALDSIELYSPATNTFTLLTSSQWQLPEPQGDHHLQLRDNILMLIRTSTGDMDNMDDTMMATDEPAAVPPPPSSPSSSSHAAGWAIDLSPYATMDHVINTRTPLQWHVFPLLVDHNGKHVEMHVMSSFITTI